MVVTGEELVIFATLKLGAFGIFSWLLISSVISNRKRDRTNDKLVVNDELWGMVARVEDQNHEYMYIYMYTRTTDNNQILMQATLVLSVGGSDQESELDITNSQ